MTYASHVNVARRDACRLQDVLVFARVHDVAGWSCNS
jgi:hypothetical protein